MRVKERLSARKGPNPFLFLGLQTKMAESTLSPVFDAQKVTVIYVLGGPGAGKSSLETQMSRIHRSNQYHREGYTMWQARRDFWLLPSIWLDFISSFSGLTRMEDPAGDLLREEQNRDGSEYGELIRGCIQEGAIVPSIVTMKLLENAMTEELEKRTGDGWTEGKGRFLIDGFPRKMDQALGFDGTVCLAALVIFFNTSEEVMRERLLKRAKTSGREDDNVETIIKRFRTYNEQTMPVIEYYKTQGKLAEIDGTGPIEEVNRLASTAVRELFS
ncbi:hypothetical protein AZE42_06262 [Rhizopogon vesiculosus]|uniref:Adenylate kinase n=1 Tax=Rhizopogon vesiculosus TaxID=180088 RepID=A0A1J8Q9A7_9AGAM|nr:hypothetical protein AZE42_06262 [Rhizopogon vesiculosus]